MPLPINHPHSYTTVIFELRRFFADYLDPAYGEDSVAVNRQLHGEVEFILIAKDADAQAAIVRLIKRYDTCVGFSIEGIDEGVDYTDTSADEGRDAVWLTLGLINPDE